jgi:hypothetical protein
MKYATAHIMTCGVVGMTVKLHRHKKACQDYGTTGIVSEKD